MDRDADDRTYTASLHHLIITLHIRGNEDYLGSKTGPRVFEELYGVWSSSSFLRVPQDHSFGLNVFFDHARYR